MTTPEDFITDPWSFLDHKRQMSTTSPTGFDVVSSWVPVDERRRLAAYTILGQFLTNSARRTIESTEESVQATRREFGEPWTIRARIRDGVLGDSWSFVVAGAATDHPDAPPLPGRPPDPDGTDDEIERASREAQMRVYEDDAAGIIDEWEQAVTGQRALRALQAELDGWVDDELLPQVMIEREDDAIGLGDAVLVLRPNRGGWPSVELVDPGMFFPVFTEDEGGVFPDKIHLAWEWEEPGESEGASPTKWLRRQTYELVPLDDERVDDGARSYPWVADGETAPGVTCLLTDRVWELTGAGVRGDLYDLADDSSTVQPVFDGDDLDDDETALADEYDLGLPFIPVVHYPNTPATRSMFGVSLVAVLVQLFDEIQANDTDIADASDYIAGPVVGMASDRSVAQTDEDPRTGEAGKAISPGMIIEVGPDGNISTLDLSGGIEKLMARADQLLDRLAVNSQVTSEVLGRVDSATAVSGVSMALAFGPFQRLVSYMRTTRKPKDRMVARMAVRMAQAEDATDFAGSTPDIEIAYGSYLPSDQKGTVDLVVALRAATPPIISPETALRMLRDAGVVDVADVLAEIRAIEHADIVSALALADALNDEAAARDRLGLEPNRTEAAPVEDLVPAGVGNPVPPVTGGGNGAA